MSRFNLQQHLDRLYQSTERHYALPDEMINWQGEFRLALLEVLGITGRIPTEIPETELLSSQDKGTHIEEKHVFILDDVTIPMYLLIPKTEVPYKPMLAFHGHGIGVKQILGNYSDEITHQKMLTVDENFAQRFAEDGYLVCAIEQRGFGERITEQLSSNNNSCRHLAFEYMMLGKTLLGERIRDAIAAINYLTGRNDISQNVLGNTGHSGGATTALFLAAIDTRITHSVISAYFCDYQQSILGMPHCECNYVPNLLTLGNIGDIASLIAPRDLCILHGEQDPIFPIDGVHKAYQTLSTAYQSLNAGEKCVLMLHPAAHQYNYAMSHNWLTEHIS